MKKLKLENTGITLIAITGLATLIGLSSMLMVHSAFGQSASEVRSRTSIKTQSHAFLSTAAPRSSLASCSGVGRFFKTISIIPCRCDGSR